MKWIARQLAGAWRAVSKDRYCLVAYYPASQTFDVYAFRTRAQAEAHLEGMRILYAWADDVEWHIRPLYLRAVRDDVIQEALAGKRGRIS